jgi:hypothetical protein
MPWVSLRRDGWERPIAVFENYMQIVEIIEDEISDPE